ncbi:MAG: plasmid maintenance protein CcdB [Gammaproteobacteria bacterium]|nr:MAG: plasmid maintenance protein CcdB [Pseudomonadota bacterium]PIE38344.1 MAG: plasmid maintenance protein CcdB [Gammaproteobacteria bacterium]
MSQFSLYRNNDKKSKKTYPYFVDVQNNLLSELNSRLVIPLAPTTEVDNKIAKKLCPVITVEGKDHILVTSQLTTVPGSILKSEVESLEKYRYQIIDAIDMLITGI